MGYHGISLETIKYALKHGVIPGATIKTDEQNTHDFPPYGWIYFFPTLEGLPILSRREYTPSTEEEAITDSSGYARDLAEAHYFLSTLNLPFDNPVARSASLFLTNDYFPGDEESEEELRELFKLRPDLKRNHVENILREIKISQPKGFVLGLSRTCLDSEDVMALDLDSDQYELRMHIPNGLNFKFICSIKPMGSREQEFLNNLSHSWWSRLTQSLGNR